MNDKYAGAAWNQLMENETKESLAELYLDSLDRIRNLKKELANELCYRLAVTLNQLVVKTSKEKSEQTNP